jgi:gas vesicle protein
MTRMTTTRSIRAVAGVFAVSALLLTGCTGGQSKEEACTQLNTELEDAQTELQDSISNIASDPDGAIDALETFQGSFSDSVDDISNDEIKDLGENVEEALDDYIEVTSDAVDDPENADSAALTDAIEEFQTQTEAFSEACGS